MSELRAYKADVTIPVYDTIADAEVYLKPEADKVFAEKDKEIAELKADYSAKVEEPKNVERKCLAMAEKWR